MGPDDVRRSRRLSLVLRHRPETVGLRLDPHGWVEVGRLLEGFASHGWPLTRDELDRVVSTNDKQRFEWDLATDRIRARQGHTVEVDLDLQPAAPPPVLFHGTPTRNLDSIRRHGLLRQRRHHVHLSADEATAHRVGARRGEHVVLRVDAAAMTRDGHTFARSTNGVWLTDAVPAAYLEVLERG